MWAVALAAISLLLASLTGRRGFATGAVAISFLLTYTLAEILLQVETDRRARRTAGPGQPRRPAVAAWRRRSPACSARSRSSTACACGSAAPTRPTTCPSPGAFGAVYALVLIALVGLCLAGLGARYRKARLS